MKIKIGDSVIMPEPTCDDDLWTHGGFCATVIGFRDVGSGKPEDQLATVVDGDDEAWDIEVARLAAMVSDTEWKTLTKSEEFIEASALFGEDFRDLHDLISQSSSVTFGDANRTFIDLGTVLRILYSEESNKARLQQFRSRVDGLASSTYIALENQNMTKTQAIKHARAVVGALYKFGNGWCRNTKADMGWCQSTPSDYYKASASRSQGLIDAARFAMGLDNHTRYDGGKWTSYLD